LFLFSDENAFCGLRSVKNKRMLMFVIIMCYHHCLRYTDLNPPNLPDPLGKEPLSSDRRRQLETTVLCLHSATLKTTISTTTNTTATARIALGRVVVVMMVRVPAR
jgi:hypothetical protein